MREQRKRQGTAAGAVTRCPDRGLLLLFTILLAAAGLGIAPARAETTAALEIRPLPLSALIWSFSNGPEFPGARGNCTVETGTAPDSASLRIDFDFTEGGGYVLARTTLPDTPARLRALRFHVDTAAGVALLLRLVDASGQTFQKKHDLRPGSQRLELAVEPPWVAVFGGAGDSRIHRPLRGLHIGLERTAASAGAAAISGLELQYAPATELAVRLYRERQQFTAATLPGWRRLWNQTLAEAATLEQLLAASRRLESYALPVDRRQRADLQVRLERVWRELDGIGSDWDRLVNDYGLLKTEPESLHAAARAADIQRRLIATSSTVRAAIRVGRAQLGGNWLGGETSITITPWRAGTNPKAAFADQWQWVLGPQISAADLHGAVVGTEEFAVVAFESLQPGLRADQTLDPETTTRLERFLQSCGTLGLRGMPNYFNTALDGEWGPELPDWFLAEHGRDNAGLRYGDGRRITLNYWYPPTLALTADYIRQSAAHADGDPRILAFEFWNEPSLYQVHEVYDNEHVRQAFKEWLQTRYGTVRKLNARWGTRYHAIRAALPPSGFAVLSHEATRATRSRTFDFRLFLRESFAAFFRRGAAAFHESNSTHPLMPQWISFFNFHQDNMIDTFLLQSAGWDILANHDGGGSLSHYEGHWGFGHLNYTASHAAILGKPVFADEYIWSIPESGGGANERLYGDPQPAAVVRRAARRNLLEQVAWGRCGVEVFSYRPSSGWGNQLMAESGQRLGPQAAWVRPARRLAEKLREVTRATQIVFPDIAILETIDATYCSTPAEIPLSEAMALDRLCSDRQMPLFFLPERALLAGQAKLEDFRVIIAPYCCLLSHELSDRLAAWVENGGYLIASGPVGITNGYGRAGGGLSTLLPLNQQLQPPAENGGAVLAVPGADTTVDLAPWRRLLWRLPPAPEPGPDTNIVVAAVDGTPLITETRAGKGWIVQSLLPLGIPSADMGAPEHFKAGHPASRLTLGPPETGLQPLVWSILTRHGDPRSVRSDCREVSLVRHRGARGQDYVFAINLDPLAATQFEFEMPERFRACRDLLLDNCPVPIRAADNGTRVELTLAPGDGTLLLFER